MSQFLSRLFGRAAAAARSAAKPRRTQLGLETLEARDVPAVTIKATNPTPHTTQILITSDNRSDTVIVTHHKNYIDEEGYPVAATVGFIVNGKQWGDRYVRHADYLNKIVFVGNAGNDKLINYTNIRTEAFGGKGMDTLFGGFATDTLRGGDDNDFLVARQTPGTTIGDHLFGDIGHDYLMGSEGKDNMHGGASSDTLVGMGGNDMLWGDSGRDYLYGSIGNDTLDGGDDGFFDTLHGGPGVDRFQMDGGPDPILANYNRDIPSDFSAADGDSYFGADPQGGIIIL